MRTKVYNSPMRDFVTFANAMNRAFNNEFSNYDFARNGGHNGSSQHDAKTSKMRLPVDVWTEDEAFVISAYLPGVRPDDVEITMEGEELTIRGSFPALPQAEAAPAEEGQEDAAEESSNITFIKRELFRGMFERRMTINVPVDVDNIEATYENGLLTLRVPKAEAVRPKQIKIVAK